jgi:hypothetical protein
MWTDAVGVVLTLIVAVTGYIVVYAFFNFVGPLLDAACKCGIIFVKEVVHNERRKRP